MVLSYYNESNYKGSKQPVGNIPHNKVVNTTFPPLKAVNVLHNTKTNNYFTYEWLQNRSNIYDHFNNIKPQQRVLNCIVFQKSEIKVEGPFLSDESNYYYYTLTSTDVGQPFSPHYHLFEGKITSDGNMYSLGDSHVDFLPIIETENSTFYEGRLFLLPNKFRRVYYGKFFLPFAGKFDLEIVLVNDCYSAHVFRRQGTQYYTSVTHIPFEIINENRLENFSLMASIFKTQMNSFKSEIDREYWENNGLWIPLQKIQNGVCDDFLCKSKKGTSLAKIIGTGFFATFNKRPYIYDNEEIYSCLSRKRVKFFGDSTIDELFEQIFNMLKAYEPKTEMKFFGGVVNLKNSYLQGPNLFFRNRGIRHADPFLDFGGIEAVLNDNKALNEISLLANQSDVVLTSTLLHDIGRLLRTNSDPHNIDEYVSYLMKNAFEKYFEMMKQWKNDNPNLKIIWKEVSSSNNWKVGSSIVHLKIDQLVKEMIRTKYPFITVFHIDQMTRRNSFRGPISDGMHFGARNYYEGGRKDETVANMLLQSLLNIICS